MITTAILIIVWILFSALEGWSEGMFYAAKYDCTLPLRKQDQHKFWMLKRAVVFLGLLGVYVSWDWPSIAITAIFGLGLALLFPFIHDGWQFVSRNKHDPDKPYPDGFWTDKDGPAKNDFTLMQRIAMFGVGLVVLAMSMWLKIRGMEEVTGLKICMTMAGGIVVATVVYLIHNKYFSKWLKK
jgi:hypothetical protein